jgi:ArsR family transcriptional regulator, arsenate/arsenite/antimonite-responsive transcriptional repressor
MLDTAAVSDPVDIYVYPYMSWRMNKHRKGDPAFLFKTLADPTRLRLLNLLACGETCVCELTDTLGVVQPKVSRHLAHLKRAGLVEARRNGKWMHYRWAQHGDLLVRHVLSGLREWMARDDAMNGERRRRHQVCCRISRRRPKGTLMK